MIFSLRLTTVFSLNLKQDLTVGILQYNHFFMYLACTHHQHAGVDRGFIIKKGWGANKKITLSFCKSQTEHGLIHEYVFVLFGDNLHLQQEKTN